VFLLHPLLVYSLRDLIGVPDTPVAVLVHGLVLPLVYAVVCAAVTLIALRIPVVRVAFGEIPAGVAAATASSLTQPPVHLPPPGEEIEPPDETAAPQEEAPPEPERSVD
jgi:hypothetical protein